MNFDLFMIGVIFITGTGVVAFGICAGLVINDFIETIRNLS